MAMGRPPNEQTILRRQESLALRLLDRALDGKDIPVDVQLDVFEKVGKWVSIKNRLADMEETDIDRFKHRIHGTEAKASKGRADREPEATPDKLAGIKNRISGRSNSSSDGNSGDPGVEVPPAAGG